MAGASGSHGTTTKWSENPLYEGQGPEGPHSEFRELNYTCDTRNMCEVQHQMFSPCMDRVEER